MSDPFLEECLSFSDRILERARIHMKAGNYRDAHDDAVASLEGFFAALDERTLVDHAYLGLAEASGIVVSARKIWKTEDGEGLDRMERIRDEVRRDTEALDRALLAGAREATRS